MQIRLEDDPKYFFGSKSVQIRAVMRSKELQVLAFTTTNFYDGAEAAEYVVGRQNAYALAYSYCVTYSIPVLRVIDATMIRGFKTWAKRNGIDVS